MPAYIVSELDAHVPVLSPGVVGYSTGSYNDRVPPTRMQVSNVSLTSNVATLTVLILEGYIPLVGALISVRGTQSASGAFNVSNVALASVTIDKITGAGTVTFALTHADVASAPDSGAAMVPQPEVGEALTSTTTGLQFGLQSMLLPNNGRDVSWSTLTPSAPSSYTAHLQGAEFDVEAQYVDLDTMTAPGTQIVNGVRANFLRIKWTSVSGGTNPTGVGKILV